MLMPKISVIMPVYNTDNQYLSEAIDSVLQQTYTDFELLVIDDGSTIDYANFISSYSDQRISYFKLPKNVGIARARNFGLGKTTGEFIAFLDSDDVAMPERFERQIHFLENNPNIDCVGSSFLIIPENRFFHNPIEHYDIVLYLLLHGSAFLHSSVMLRKKIITENDIYYHAHYVPAEDYAFWLDLVGLCNFANIDEILVNYRWHGANISITKAEIQQSLANEAKINKLLTLINRLDANTSNAMLNYFVRPEQLSLDDLHLLEDLIPSIVQKLSSMGLEEKTVKFVFRKNFTKIMRKTPSKVIARKACLSSLNNYLLTGWHRQLFYYFVKGII